MQQDVPPLAAPAAEGMQAESSSSELLPREAKREQEETSGTWIQMRCSPCADLSQAWTKTRTQVFARTSPDLEHHEMEEEADTLKTLLASDKVHVTNMYSPLSSTVEAPFEGLRAGKVFDVEPGWNFSDPGQFNMAQVQAAEVRPALVAGSPPCSATMSRGADAQRRQEGETHVERVITMYEDQLDRGGWISHEHQWCAESWDDPRVDAHLARRDVYNVRSPMCQWRKEPQDHPRVAHMKNETCCTKNSRVIARHTQPGVQSETQRPHTQHGVAQIPDHRGSKTRGAARNSVSHASGAKGSEGLQA